MTPELHHLILTYGYWLMAFGAIIEGETFLLAGGIAAQQGLLHLPGLLLLALVGSCMHDWSLFFIGRYFGDHYLKNKPQFQDKAGAVLKLLDRYGVWLIIGLRYAYGLRTIIPTVLGISPISSKKFIFFDIIGGILWSCTFILGGYFLGKAFERFLHMVWRYEDWAFNVAMVLGVFAVIIFALYLHFRRRK